MGSKVRKLAIISMSLFVLALPLGADSHHVMQSGDTLYSLSRQYGVTVDELLAANGISDPASLSVGMNLLIPGEDSTGISSSVDEYTVKQGDTYYSIARVHEIPVDELLRLNGRSSDRILRVGETLVVLASGNGGGTRPVPVPIPGPSPTPGPERVTRVPWWPVAGMKVPLDGKLVGVSISADSRSYVHAVSDGNVVWTGPYRGFGHVVLVDSDGYIYLYGGNEDLFVNVGQTVSTGSRIGRLGASGPDGETREMIFSVFREGVPVSPDDAPRG